MSQTFPGQAAAGDLTGLSLPPPEAKTPPLPTTPALSTKYYYCPIPNTSMFRPDGMRLPFIKGVYEAKLKATQEYLDKEIAEAHPFLTEANPEQVQTYKMFVDPRGTIAESLRPQVEEEVREKLEKEIMDTLRSKGIEVDDLFKLAGTDRAASQEIMTASGTGRVSPPHVPSASSFQAGVVGSDKLAGGAAGSSSTSSLPSGVTAKA